MRKEIVELEQLLEIQRLQNMAWWETSDQYQEELEASEEVREEYEEMLKELSPELCAILDRIEEAWYLMKEAELQAMDKRNRFNAKITGNIHEKC